jgi:hypothetical protein
MPWEHGGWARVRAREERISLLRFGYRTAQDVTGRHRGLVGPAMADLAATQSEIRSRAQARKGDTVSATVLHMSQVRELWEERHGS